jgi:hypothetical protein
VSGDDHRRPPFLTEIAEYSGQKTVRVACTQLGSNYSASEARRVVKEWVEFFSSGPSGILDLEFTTRTPKRLFESLRTQTQLRRLAVKWGDYDDLSALSGHSALRELSLHGASCVTSVEPLRSLVTLRRLTIESLRRVHDLSPLGRLTGLTDLELGGDWMSPRKAHVDSIGFLRDLIALEEVLLHTIIVDDLDYSPLLGLPRLRSVRVMKVRGMRPPHEHLKSVLPWSA